MAKVGRRRGAGTRDQIIEAARAAFLENGYTDTTLRAVARRAEVDPALIYHYFGDKAGLFVASQELPGDPRKVQVESRSPKFSGARLVEMFLAQWETDVEHPGQSFAVLAQAVAASPAAARSLREFLEERVWANPPPGLSPEQAQRGHAFVASQLIGLAWARYILQIEPVASMPLAEVAAGVGPTLDRYMRGKV
jgi:AcrR family transcriptional regulator